MHLCPVEIVSMNCRNVKRQFRAINSVINAHLLQNGRYEMVLLIETL